MQNVELRQARDEREKLLGIYTDLYDFAPVGYVTLDRDGTIRGANLTVATLLGIERSRLLGQRFGQFVTAAAGPAFAAFLARVFGHQGKESCEVALLKEGVVQIEAAAAASGEECRAAIIDISARRQLEEKLEILLADLAARAAELEAANVELEAFNYSVSHDLRGPLTIIAGYCDVVELIYGSKLEANCRDYIQAILEGAMRMKRLIDTLLDFSRVQRVAMCREKVDLSSLAEEVALALEVEEPARRITFRCASGLVADGDADLLRLVLSNLIGNAWKHSGQREETVIEFDVTEIDGNPVYFVRDNGPGFDPAFAGTLFLPFQRLPGMEVEGHGIGLATVDRIVRRHGGSVWTESRPGEGATFFFTLG
jgi:light-regulated signal transduction histidine kinase (bacteriophytochrome)